MPTSRPKRPVSGKRSLNRNDLHGPDHERAGGALGVLRKTLRVGRLGGRHLRQDALRSPLPSSASIETRSLRSKGCLMLRSSPARFFSITSRKAKSTATPQMVHHVAHGPYPVTRRGIRFPFCARHGNTRNMTSRTERLREIGDAGRDIVVEAVYLAQRIDTRQLEGRRLGTTPLVIEAGAEGLCVLFRYGVVVFINVTPTEEASHRSALAPLLKERFDTPVRDHLLLTIDPDEGDRVRDGVVVCSTIDIERLQVIADALAKSVALVHYEETASSAFEEVEPLALQLERKGFTPRNPRALAKRIGSTLRTLTRTVGRVEASEKPEVLWEHPELDVLYARLSDEFELVERHRALERKLDVVSRAAGALLDLRLHAQSLRVEWYIVLLIVIEIVISLYELSR